MNWDARYELCADIARGVQYLHSQSILHHDLKSLNILLTKKAGSTVPMAKLADFGEARLKNSFSKRDRIDNPTWLAPELLGSQPQFYTKKSESYSYSIIMWEILCRSHPFQEHSVANSPFRSTFEEAIVAGLRPSPMWKNSLHLFESEEDQEYLTSYTRLMRTCWHDDPKSRPSFDEIVSFLTRVYPPCAEIPTAEVSNQVTYDEDLFAKLDKIGRPSDTLRDPPPLSRKSVNSRREPDEYSPDVPSRSSIILPQLPTVPPERFGRESPLSPKNVISQESAHKRTTSMSKDKRKRALSSEKPESKK